MKKQKDFVVPHKLKNEPEIPPGAKLYYAQLVNIADGKGMINHSVRELAQIEDVTSTTIHNWNNILQFAGYIFVESIKTGRGEQTINRICLL